jgi:hypothetical protein
MGRPEEPPELAPFWRVIRGGMLDVEPPDHTRLRRLVSRAFTPRTVERLRATVQSVTDRLVDDALAQGECDLLATVAEPLPVTVIAEMLGVPEADRHLLRPWSADICGMYELEPSEQTARAAVRACVEFGDYLVQLSRGRRARPQDDLITALTQVVDEGDVLTEDELVGTCVLLLNAGHEATVNVTGNGWWALFRHPDELARLRSDPSLLPTAVEELMRWDTPLQVFERWVLEDLELGGTAVPRGAELGLLFGSANRDPEVFDDPGRLDVGRTPTRTSPSARRALLPGRRAGPAGAADLLRHGAAPAAGARAARGAGVEAGVRHPRARVAAGQGGPAGAVSPTVHAHRLASQRLSGPAATSVGEVVHSLLAVQAQDLRGARLAVRARSTGLTSADVDVALADGSVVVGWLNRGTLHLVRSEDYWWLHALTAPTLRAGNARRLAQEGVSPEQAEVGVEAVVRELADGPRDRDHLREVVRAAGVPVAGQALVHVLSLAALRGHVVRGPMTGALQAFVLAEDWLGPSPAVDRDAALAELARRYLRGHAPADARDLARWAGLPLRDARQGMAAVDGELVHLPDGRCALADGPVPAPVPPPRLWARSTRCCSAGPPARTWSACTGSW